jgi:hypothetical protein
MVIRLTDLSVILNCQLPEHYPLLSLTTLPSADWGAALIERTSVWTPIDHCNFTDFSGSSIMFIDHYSYRISGGTPDGRKWRLSRRDPKIGE